MSPDDSYIDGEEAGGQARDFGFTMYTMAASTTWRKLGQTYLYSLC